MIKPQLILIGAGGHARSCIDVIEEQDYFKIAGLVGLPEQRGVQQMDYGYSVIGSDSDLFDLAKTYQYALITIGQIQTAEHRVRLYQRATQLGFQLPAIIAPTAHVSRHATIGAGTIVMHGAIVNAGASIGNNCIINSRALIEHDSRVEDHCHISTGAILNGDVTVGATSFIGSGSIIKQSVTLGRGCLVGMGIGVKHDLHDCTQFTGYGKHAQ
jgi:sugar O-acyltransferase (sialic acid O-acetyltransferase NeuD family)